MKLIGFTSDLVYKQRQTSTRKSWVFGMKRAWDRVQNLIRKLKKFDKVALRVSGPYFSGFRLNTGRYFVSVSNQSECGKIPAKIILNIDTFYAVMTASHQLSSYND